MFPAERDLLWVGLQSWAREESGREFYLPSSHPLLVNAHMVYMLSLSPILLYSKREKQSTLEGMLCRIPVLVWLCDL